MHIYVTSLASPDLLARSSRTQKPYLVIEPEQGWSTLGLNEIWRYRDLILQLALRDLRLRYKQTALGAIWVVLQPLLAAGIFSFVFGIVADLPSDGVPYFLFSYAGLLGWNLFSQTVSKASTCLVGNQQLVSKVFFPRVVLLLSTLPSVLVDFGVSLLLLGVLFVVFGLFPGWSLLLLPLSAVLLLMLGLGVGLFTSALAVRYRDVKYMLPVVQHLLLYASPVAYAASAVPEAWRTWYYLNPLAAVLETCRVAALGVPGPSPLAMVYSIACAVLCLTAGVFAFKRMERTFADII